MSLLALVRRCIPTSKTASTDIIASRPFLMVFVCHGCVCERSMDLVNYEGPNRRFGEDGLASDWSISLDPETYPRLLAFVHNLSPHMYNIFCSFAQTKAR